MCQFLFPVFLTALVAALQFQDIKTQVDGALFNLAPSFSYAGVLRSLLSLQVTEKKSKLRETLRIMGMKQSGYVLSWLITELITAFIISILVIAISTANQNLYGPWFGQFILIMIVSGFVYISYGFLLTPFFSDPQLASQLGLMLHIIPAVLFYIVKDKDASYKYGLSIFPQVGVLVYINQAVYDAFANQPNLVLDDLEIQKNYILLMLIIEIFLYFILFIYLDQVFPNQFGISKHPFYFCKKSARQIAAERKNSNMKRDSVKKNGAYRELTNQDRGLSLEQHNLPIDQTFEEKRIRRQSAKYAKFQESTAVDLSKEIAVEIINMHKRFGGFTAVNNLSLQMYSNQIFCILGHNGAGKTTTLNMLTGIYPPSKGTARIFDQDINSNIDQVRQSLGLCQQFDVVIDELSIEQHLQLMCGLRNLPKNQWKEKIQQALECVNLQDEFNRHKRPTQLSGGMKRRLSMALALLGYSNLIVLDEPTSGLDPMTRQQVWNIIRKIKKQRCVILTTQHLEQADELADRIGIMSHGQLLCLGSAPYIKRRFGVGYHLIIEPKMGYNQEFDENKIKAIEVIKDIIPDSQKDPKTAKYQVSFLLPFKDMNLFPKLFQQLEKFEELQINVEISSLQDAFINIARIQQESQKLPGQIFDQDQIKEHEPKKKRMDFYRTQQLLKLRIPNSFRYPPKSKFCTQTSAVIKKRLLAFHRDWRMWILLIFSVIIVLISAAAFQSLWGGTDKTTQLRQIHQTLFSYLFASWVVIGLALCTGIFIDTPVYQRQHKLRYALKVTGLSDAAYWCGLLIADMMLYIIPGLCFIALIFLFNIATLTTYIYYTVPLYIVFGGALITFMYITNYLFDKSEKAFKYIGLILYLLGYIVPVSLQFVVKQFSSCTVWKVIDVILSLIPIQQLYNAQVYMLVDYLNIDQNNNRLLACKGIFSDTWQIIIFFVVQTAAYLLITIFIDRAKMSLSQNRSSSKKRDISSEFDFEEAGRARADSLKPDNDVEAEAARVKNGYGTGQLQDQNIQVLNLHKRYPNGFYAVKGTNFTVGKNEVLGLLGPNGAGKSTTFNMVTLDVPMSRGNVNILGNEITQNMNDVFIELGMCPQYNPIWNKLTVLQHLEIFTDIKGLSTEDKKDQMFYLIKSLKLEEYINVNAQNLSGGNKRKLCTAIAQIACPLVSFFDQPTTGVDPVSRRNLWFSLKNSSGLRGGSLILTTHRMDQAETLCDKIAIMINGRFVCFGSPQQLRNKYGSGYFINIKPKAQIGTELPARKIQEMFPSSKLQTQTTETTELTFKIENDQMVLSEAFYGLIDMREKSLIDEFSIAQSTLETVFLYFAKFQKLNAAAEPGKVDPFTDRDQKL